ncbi:TPA: hypothetical protein DIV55_06465 [Patescibacteria group bacterium]|uniref:Uncharacterized protein n=1 Tax=Candidatus Curtissbacteria bacterium GW2011_GWA1_40_16 TaxID=1618405 RepID=A0A0G0RDT6_9BACT|nr:MAG: hypothetical protein UT84_C0005G0020 [Candidatus Curtissbacteria bacterium GW2011_GWA1_40_16]HCS79348.1 hypothetical protein [Patescibacteria group bacterium]
MAEKHLSDILDKILKASIVFLTLALVWFSVVFYPKAINKFKSQPKNDGGLIENVQASSRSLPYVNSHFTIEYLSQSNVYVIMVSAQTVDQYAQYKSEAELTLKNILSMDRLCGLNVLYSSNLPFAHPEKSSQSHC